VAGEVEQREVARILFHLLESRGETRGHAVGGLFKVVLEPLGFELAILLEELETQPRKGAAEQGHGREKDGQGARRSAHSD
jgi:hypothetical protein